ncbi:PH domain-containing protein [Rhodohalobacter halophilus]|uniref:PH domain-containing protein n=1 Tax=Rhodohalobacter halophilus TaxID=1812810 RepID=UPI00083FACCD|nr:PH domain-containing protein [Rhodohalobacter halophilus]
MTSKKFQKKEGEDILIRSNQHPSIFYGGVLFLIYNIAVILAGEVYKAGLIFIMIGLFWTVFGYFKWTYREYIVTNKRLVIVSGYYYLQTEEYPFNKVDNITLYQNWVDKFWNKGMVTLFGIGIRTKKIKGLKSAERLKNAIHSQLSVNPESYFSS